jgi:hypothetical protein
MKATKKELLDGLNTFTRSFIACGLELAEDGEDGFIKDKYIWDVDRKSLEKIIADCTKFLQQSRLLLDFGDSEMMERAGYDFWLTRCGHGVGFWDREDYYGEEEAKALTDLCKGYITCDFYRNPGSRWVGWEAM